MIKKKEQITENEGLISVDRSNKATLPRTITRSLLMKPLEGMRMELAMRLYPRFPSTSSKPSLCDEGNPETDRMLVRM